MVIHTDRSESVFFCSRELDLLLWVIIIAEAEMPEQFRWTFDTRPLGSGFHTETVTWAASYVEPFIAVCGHSYHLLITGRQNGPDWLKMVFFLILGTFALTLIIW